MATDRPLERDFASEGLAFRDVSMPRRLWEAVWGFIRHKPLGAFGLGIVLFWTVFAVGTLGDGGGWLGIGRYDHLTVFREPSQEFADSRAARAFDGLAVGAAPAELRARLPDTAYLGPLASSREIDSELHAYVLSEIESGGYLQSLAERDPPLLEARNGVYVQGDSLFLTGAESPVRTATLRAPSGVHWFGTDRAGQDIYARIAEGSRLSLMVGVFAAAIAVGTGLLIGLAAGYLGGNFDLFSQRVMDALQAFPPLIFLLLLASVTRGSLTMTILALGALGVADTTRVVRGSVIGVRESQYVEAARALGASGPRIALRHILPNIMAPVIVIYTISIGAYILAEAALSFLGLGPIQVSWGKMVADGRQFIISGSSPWLSLFAGLAITTLVFGFNVAGDGLRDALDPRLRGGR